MMIFALFLENMADTSYLSGKGMGYFMLLAMAIKGSYVSKKNVRGIAINEDAKSTESVVIVEDAEVVDVKENNSKR